MLEDKTKECDGSYRCRLRQNKMRDMMDRIGVVYTRRQNKKKNATDPIGVYAGR